MANTSTVRRPRGDKLRCASVESARMPPSPRLSARRMTITYLSVTIVNSAQETKDSTPSTVASVSGRTPCGPKATRIV